MRKLVYVAGDCSKRWSPTQVALQLKILSYSWVERIMVLKAGVETKVHVPGRPCRPAPEWWKRCGFISQRRKV
jgi:hypothetical protein